MKGRTNMALNADRDSAEREGMSGSRFLPFLPCPPNSSEKDKRTRQLSSDAGSVADNLPSKT